MPTSKNTKAPSRWARINNKLTPATNWTKNAAKWVYDYPYGYVRLLLIAGMAGMFVYTYVKDHVTIGGADAVAGVVAVIVVAHLLGGLKAIKRS